MQFIGYLLFRFLVFIFYLVPFWLLYIYSDIFYFFLFNVLNYRKNVVFGNLKRSFPEKSEKEIKRIAKAFYINLCDITFESIKGLSMNKKALIKRYSLLNVEILDDYFKNGQSIIGLASHYTNWEWGVISFGIQFKHKSIGLYKPISNKYIDKYVKRSRAVLDMNLVSIYETYKAFEEKHEKPAVIFMISDQSPSNIKKAKWVNFLNQDTACLHGVEAYAKKYDLPIVYGDVQRIKRGFYTVTLSIFETKPVNTGDGEITENYMRKLEDIIKAKPENWLWSHRRWKHKRDNT